MKTSRKSNYL